MDIFGCFFEFYGMYDIEFDVEEDGGLAPLPEGVREEHGFRV
jgi:hypothetical protein